MDNKIFIGRLLVYIVKRGIIILALSLLYSPILMAQNWTELPPYNTLWPLWSPALSPLDPVAGISTPIVSSLKPSTVLPVQPGLTWDPALGYPWLLYNTPFGLAYYDPGFGVVDMWPPASLLDPSGLPLPISLPINYTTLPPTDSTFISTYIGLLNFAYQIRLYELFTLYPIPPTPLTITFYPPDVIGFGLPSTVLPYLTTTTSSGPPALTTPTVVVPPVITPTAILGFIPAVSPSAIFSWTSPFPLPVP